LFNWGKSVSQHAICFALTLACLLTGCATWGGSKAMVRGKEIAGVNYIDFPSERRGAWAVNEEVAGKVIICAEPFSDTGVSTEQLISLAAKLPKDQGGAQASTQTIQNLVELKGRTPAVLAMRDVMYRMCERRMSTGDARIPADELLIYEKIVDVIDKFALAEKADAQAKQAVAEQQQSKPFSSGVGKAASRYQQAKEAQDRGFELLAQCRWKEAEQSFAMAESVYRSFQVSYEFARLLRINQGNEKAAIMGEDSAYMPHDLLERVGKCPG
jgi:hypothetical protein